MNNGSCVAMEKGGAHSHSDTSSNYEKYLNLATESNPSMILELDMETKIKYLSPVWEQIIGSGLPAIGTPISSLIVGSEADKNVFKEVLNLWITDNSDISYTVKFDICDDKNECLTVEACGVLIYDTSSGIPSHSMWIMKPTELIDDLDNDSMTTRLPENFINILGQFGSYLFLNYLDHLKSQLLIDEENLPDPNLELCRVCESFIPDWWLESHSKSCVCEYRINTLIQVIQENLSSHKALLENLLIHSNEQNLQYKDALINNNGKNLEAIEHLVELVETSIKINTSDFKSTADIDGSMSNNVMLSTLDDMNNMNLEFSPNTNINIEKVRNWKFYSEENMNDYSDSVKLMIEDTFKLANEKLDAVLRLNNSMTFSSKIKNEVNTYVFQLMREQLENNRIFLLHNYGLDMKKNENNAIMLDNSKTMLLNEKNLLNSSNIENLSKSLAPVESNLFLDSYTECDHIPINAYKRDVPSTGIDNNNHKSFDMSVTSVNSPIPTSVTTEKKEEETQEKQLVHVSSTKPDYSYAIDDRESFNSIKKSASTASINSATALSSKLMGNYLGKLPNMPKMKTSITLTSRRGSPLLTSSSSSTSVIHSGSNSNSISNHSQTLPPNNLLPISLNSGNATPTSKLVDEKKGSPANSPFTLSHDYLTPEQHSNSFTVPKQPLSPLLLPTNHFRSLKPSIKNYEIIKPISKGAYGSVYLARKKLTGDNVAIKVLKKSDMIAKNQVTNVKSERAIMMVQSDKPYVAHLYESFQNKDNLFLVMEYLPGGDLATVIKFMGYLPSNWAKSYICEIIIGVEDMHENGIIHHDLKPENLLIDKEGHLKLTDFGLSRAGLVSRHRHNPTKTKHHSFSSNHSGNSISSNLEDDDMNAANLVMDNLKREHEKRDSVLFNDTTVLKSIESSGSMNFYEVARTNSPLLQTTHTRARANSNLSESNDSSVVSDLTLFHPDDMKLDKKNFFGTPDYLAPETIKGSGEDNQCDWWSVGCILFELYFGYPPFHADNVNTIFKNILSGNIQWPEFSSREDEEKCLCPVAKDLIKKFLEPDPEKRLGANGTEEIKNHPYFKNVNWDRVFIEEPSFVPSLENPEDTDYFDLRGAVIEDFGEDVQTDDPPSMLNIRQNSNTLSSNNANGIGNTTSNETSNSLLGNLSISSVLGSDSDRIAESTSLNPVCPPTAIPPHMREKKSAKFSELESDFGSFNYRNLSALDKANKDAINRLKNEHLSEHSSKNRRNSITTIQSSSSDSSTSRQRMGKTPALNSPALGHLRRSSITSENGTVPLSLKTPDKFTEWTTPKYDPLESPTSPIITITPHAHEESISARHKSLASPMLNKINSPTTSTPVRLKTRNSSKTSSQRTSFDEITAEEAERLQAISKVSSLRNRRRSARKSSQEKDNDVKLQIDVLLCEPISIHRYCMTKELEKLGCTVVSVGAGDELVSRATSGVKFDLIITALKLPKVGAIDIAKLLKHTNGINSSTPIVAATSYCHEAAKTNVFSDILERPVSAEILKKLITKNALLKSQNVEESIASDTDVA